MEENQNSSAYSSLANSTNEISETVTVVGSGPGPTNFDDELRETSKTTTAASLEIRNIIEDYNATLNRATNEIKKLTSEKLDLEKEYENLLTINETLAKDLENALRQKKSVREDQETVLKANEELYREAQRLSDAEAEWREEKRQLEAEVEKLSRNLDDLDRSSGVSEVLARKNSEAVEALRDEKTRLVASVARLETENERLAEEARRGEKEREEVASRNQRVSGENLQLIVESQEWKKIKAEMLADLKELKAKYKDLERENDGLRIRSEDAAKAAGTGATADFEEKVAELKEQNKNLAEWREQLIEKNRALVAENRRLRDKCANLEELLNEEETDINDVLELIRTMQLASKNGANPGPISPMSAVGAKLRDFNAGYK